MDNMNEQGPVAHETPADTDILIRAMSAAGYTYDGLESTDDHLRFFGEGGQLMTMAGWQECEAWLNGVVFDDPFVAVQVEQTLHPEGFASQVVDAKAGLRTLEDLLEQNDNSFDGILNNLPECPQPGIPDPMAGCRCAGEADERQSILKRLREQEEQAAKRPSRERFFHRQDRERSME